MTDLLGIVEYDFSGQEKQSVLASELYNFLWLSKTNYQRWLQKTVIEKWIEGYDYILCHIIDDLARDAYLALDYAKAISMMSTSDKGMEVRQYFINVEKAYKKIISAPLVEKPLSVLELLESAAREIREKGNLIERLEVDNRRLLDQKARGFVIKAKETKTGLKVLKDDLGARINVLVQKIYGDIHPSDHSAMHRHAWSDYYIQTGAVYNGAKTATLDSKKRFLDWLEHGERK